MRLLFLKSMVNEVIPNINFSLFYVDETPAAIGGISLNLAPNGYAAVSIPLQIQLISDFSTVYAFSMDWVSLNTFLIAK